MVRSKNQYAIRSLKRIIGDELFSQVLEEFKGETIYFSTDLDDRDMEIKERFDAGVKPLDLSIEYNLHLSTIYKILERE